YMNSQHQQDPEYIINMVQNNPEVFFGDYQTAEYQALNSPHLVGEENPQWHTWEHHVSNRPWAALLTVSYFAFGIAGAALFFLCVQFAANAGWPIVVTRVMEGVASYIPVGGIMILIVIFAAAFGGNHLYHWMDKSLIDPNSEHYDIFIASKSKLWLNIPGWLMRSVLYVALWSLFLYLVKRATKRMDENKGDRKTWEKLFTVAVGFIVIYSLSITGMSWDWIMSIDPHWYSTLFMFYGMVSCLVAAVAVIAVISIYLKKQGALPLFNDNHQHDLAKYMFGFSLLWTYLWFCQFMLQWYAGVPEEVQYFQQRNAQYPGYYWMLLVNFLLVLLIMTSSSIKRVPQLVFVMGIMIVLGHYWDFYNQIMPGSVGGFHNFGLLEIGSLLFVSGLFTYIVFRAISKLNLEPTGNPYFHESKIYEYPF
ncbi:MAG: hypothetical protein PHO74_05785, partial [Weeksellaceae bacterium]|nr:hypothetical protein [Weeksellaceae bacterium]